ncbi:TPA: helix-turn-helix transcriptional regulator [Proteus mirabilis]|nr:helix-turn-helix transcriptional regulator [Proteus mirabilis]
MLSKVITKIVGETPHLTSETLLGHRKELGLSQSELGRLIGMSRFTISKMERGIYPISRTVELSLKYIISIQEALLNSPGYESHPKAKNENIINQGYNKKGTNKKKKRR